MTAKSVGLRKRENQSKASIRLLVRWLLNSLLLLRLGEMGMPEVPYPIVVEENSKPPTDSSGVTNKNPEHKFEVFIFI
jgi:hypothetical protein